ncbi:MAG TPA: alkaline phosphatase family protein [Thermoanaerobaculia bacterium]|nr:alkaline phosphatase family protein [Thermoanaerobaculia bacterium]
MKRVVVLLLFCASAFAADRLPTGARLDPAGRAIAVGNMPLALVLAPDHRHVVVSLSGLLHQGLQVVDLDSGNIAQAIEKRASFLGLAFHGNTLYASGGDDNVIDTFTWSDGRLTADRTIAVNYPAGLLVSADGRTLYAAENLLDDIAVIDLATGNVVQQLRTDHYPYAIAADAGRLYVSAWGGSTISIFRLQADGKLAADGRLSVGRHPSALLLRPANPESPISNSELYVALASTDEIAVVDTKARRVVRRIQDRSPAGLREGSTPNALAMSDDGSWLFVAEADNNAVAVFDANGGALLGRVPVDWYPVALIAAPDRLLVLNGKGSGSRPNPDGPRPTIERNPQFDLAMVEGTIRVIPLPLADLPALTGRVAAANNWTAQRAPRRYPPFKHVVYIIKENRTYDQVFGDLKHGDGEASLVFFGREITPNHHALAERFGLFDRFFVNAEVSSQGHMWSDAAYVTDYTEKTVHTLYAHKRPDIDEGEVDEPVEGFLWDSAARKGVPIRVYGEFANVFNKPRAIKGALDADIDPDYPSFSIKITDQHRADLWIAELEEFVRDGEMPALEIVQLPRDHTAAGKAGYSTPRACVADNDFALGRMVEALSKTPFWRDTLVVVVEDDAQDGSDHVDSHRAPFLLISAYNRPGVQHRFTNTTDAVATIEEILGLDPLSQFDYYGRPLADVFAGTPDFTPYRAIDPLVPLDEINPKKGDAARQSSSFDLSRPDAVDSAAFNRVLWQMMRARPGAP